MDKQSRKRWKSDEWNVVLETAVPLIESGTPMLEALRKGQCALPRARQRSVESLSKACSPNHREVLTKMVEQFKKLPRAKPPVTPKVQPEAAEQGSVRWTTRERVFMAAAVELLRKQTANADQPLRVLYVLAQPLVLPPERHRSKGGITIGHYSGNLKRHHDQAVKDAWQYPDSKQPFLVASKPAPAAAPPAVESAATQPATANDPRMTNAALAFGQSLTQALDALMATRDEIIGEQMARRLAASASTLHDRLGPMMQELLQIQIQQIAGEVEQRLRAVLLQELGGPAPASAPQAPPPAPIPVAPANGHAAPVSSDAMRFDIIGNIDAEWRKRVRDAVGSADEVRFIEPAKAADFAPHKGRHLIVMQSGRLPRALQKKLEVTGVRPVVVRDAAGQVLKAIEDIRRISGISLTLQ